MFNTILNKSINTILLGLLLNIPFTQSQCPEITPIDNFNLTEYIKDKWYIQKQQVTPYLPLNSNYCVTAQYYLSNKKVPFYNGLTLAVKNYANLNEVNGINLNYNNNTLCARIKNNSLQSKLLVGPCFLPNILAGDYWVVHAGPETNNYMYAIVSGGQPHNKYSDGCTTNTNTINNSGLWYFTRTQYNNQSLIDYLDTKAKKLGFTTSQLNYVNQTNCNYN